MTDRLPGLEGDHEGPGAPAAGRGSPLAPWLLFVLLAPLLALAFQGWRGVWEPDEGYYTNVALGMLDSGDWIVPRLNGQVFLDKPPLQYWFMALSMKLLGVTEWGARLPGALSYLCTGLVVGILGARFWGRRIGGLSALIYATSLLPFVAANVLTPDSLLALFTALALLCYGMTVQDPQEGGGTLWWLGLGAAIGIGALAKGPAILVFVAPCFLHFLLRRGWRRAVRDFRPYAALFVSALIGLWWYWLVTSRVQDAGAYLLDNQVVGRLFTSHYNRNPGFLAGIRIYVPTLLIGFLPWSVLWPLAMRRAHFVSSPTRLWHRLRDDPASLLVALTIVLPLVLLMCAQSRLPFYVLPLAASLSLGSARVMGALLDGNKG